MACGLFEIRMLPGPVRLQPGKCPRIKQMQSRSLCLTVLFGFEIALQWYVKIHIQHHEATLIICTPLPHPVINRFVIDSDTNIPCGGGDTPRTIPGIPQAYARGRRRSPRLGSNLPKHDEIPIPDSRSVHATSQRVRSRSTKAGNVKRCTEPETQVFKSKQRETRDVHSENFGLLSCGGNSAAEIHSGNFPKS